MSCSSPILVNGRICSCGRCVNCRKKKINDWSIRLEMERRNCRDALFVTLTYNDEHLPTNTLLSKRDLQLFFKRLRRKIDYHKLGYKIRYFASGEYGNNGTIRPHYHICLFGMPINSLVYSLILSSWNFGFIDVKFLNFDNARYVAKYCTKSMQKEKIDFSTGEVVREFVTMSRRAGIGFSCLKNKNFVNNMLKNNYLQIGKYKYSIPYSFKRKLRENPDLPRAKQTITILWNDRLYKHFSDCLVSHDYFIKYFKFWRGRQLYYDDFKFLSFTEYFKSVEASQLKEKMFFKFHIEKYFDFYRKQNFSPDLYLKSLKKYVYDNFVLLFY